MNFFYSLEGILILLRNAIYKIMARNSYAKDSFTTRLYFSTKDGGVQPGLDIWLVKLNHHN